MAALGNFEITLVRDSVYWWDGGAIFGVVPKSLWERQVAADEQNRIPVGFNCYIVRTDEHTVLIETGGGDKMDPRACERMKLAFDRPTLRDSNAREGIDPESIDVVVNSHLHWDHCGGNTILQAGGAVPAFPRARYFASRPEWEHAHLRLARDRVSYIDANYDPLVDAGRMILVEPDCEVVPGIRLLRAPGHNRDMCVVLAQSAGHTFCCLTDLVPSAAHLPPTWVAAFDLYPLETIESKTAVLQRAIEENWLCGFGHDAERDFVRLRWHRSQPAIAA